MSATLKLTHKAIGAEVRRGDVNHWPFMGVRRARP